VEKQLRGNVNKNVQHVLQRIDKMAPAKASAQGHHAGAITPPNKQVFDLIQAATSTENLSQMSPTWMPWL
jgi:phosphatidylinositol kinase/protein kinase (PI-3  family)